MDFAALPTLAGLSSDARQWTPEQWLAHMHQERAAVVAPTQSELRGLYRRAVLMLPADGQSEAFAQLLVEYARLLSDEGLNEEAEEQFRFARTLSKKFAFTHIASAQFELDRGNRAAGRAHLLTGMSAGAEPRHALVNALSLIDRGDVNLLTSVLQPHGDYSLSGARLDNVGGQHGAVAHCTDQPSSSLYGGDSQEQLHVLRDLTNSSGGGGSGGGSSGGTRRALLQSGRVPLRDLPVVPAPASAYCASASTDVEGSDKHLLYERAVRPTLAAQPRVVHRFATAGPPTAASTPAAAAPPTTPAAAATASSLPYTLGVLTSAGGPSAQRASSQYPVSKQEQQRNRPAYCSPTCEGSSVTPIACGESRRTSAAPELPSVVPASAAQVPGGRSLLSRLPEAATSSLALRRGSTSVGVAPAAAASGGRDGVPIAEPAAASSSTLPNARRPSDVLPPTAAAPLQPIAFNLQPQSNYPVASSSFRKSGAGAASASLPSSHVGAVADSPNVMVSSSPDTALSSDSASSSTLDPSHSFGWSQSGSIGIAVDPLCRVKSATDLAAGESRAARRGVYAPPPQPSLQQQHRRCSVADHGAPAPADGCSDAGTRHLSRSGFLAAASTATVATGSPHDEFDAGSRLSRHDQLAPAFGSARRSLSAGRIPSASAAVAQAATAAGGIEVKLRSSGIYAAAVPAHARHVGAACDDRSPSTTTSALPNSCFLPMRVPVGTAQRADLDSDEDDGDAPRGFAAPSVGSSANSSVSQALSRRVRTTSVQTEAPLAGSMGVSELVVVKDKEYYVLSVLGRGGSSQVRRVFDPRERTVLALKTVNLSCCSGSMPDREQALEFFAKEIRILERLQTYGNQVVKMLDFDHDRSANELHILLECGDVDLANLLKNRLLSDRQQQLLLPLQQSGAVPLPDQPSGAFIRSLWVDMLHAVAVLHKEGIIHCDLKPANFVLVAGRVKLIDFGIANELDDDVSSIALEHAAGTLNFMAPEVLCPVYPSASSVTGGGRIHDGTDGSASAAAGHDKKTKIGVRADIWSLGCILYYAVYGRTPFQLISNSSQKIAAIVNPDFVIEYPPVADSNLLDTMKMCLVRNPRQRATIEQLLQHPYVTGASSLPPTSGSAPPR